MKVKRPRGATLMQSIQKAKENSEAPSRQDGRIEFEAWADKHFIRVPAGIWPIEKGADGKYLHDNVAVAWEVWQSAVKSRAPEAPSRQDALELLKRVLDIATSAEWLDDLDKRLMDIAPEIREFLAAASRREVGPDQTIVPEFCPHGIKIVGGTVACGNCEAKLLAQPPTSDEREDFSKAVPAEQGFLDDLACWKADKAEALLSGVREP